MIESFSAFVIKNLWAIFLGIIGLIAHLVRLEWLAKGNKDRIDKLEQRLEKEVETIGKDLKDIGHEMRKGFTDVNHTLQEVIFKLGDKSDREK